MSDEPQPADSRVTRRGALALGGATLLAGCSIPGNLLGSNPVELDRAALLDVVSRKGPSVARPFPVAVADSHVTASRERAHGMLDAVPLPLTEDDMPNGAMREEVADHAEEARSSIADAVEATGDRERLELLADARGTARVVEATWAVANDESSAADVRSNRRATREAIDAFREDWTYVGEDAVRALLVHDLVEEWTASARTDLELDDSRAEVVNALVVGERAGSVEEATATLADADHVGQRFRDSLSDPRSLRSTFTDARDSLASTVDSRMADLPGEDADVNSMVDADIEEAVAGEALANVHSDLPYEGDRSSADGPADSVVETAEALARIGAFERLRDRIDAGEHRTVESAEDVRAIRSDAETAIEDALAESADERLARAIIAGPVGWFDYVGRIVERYTSGESVEHYRVAREIATYVQIEAIALATPAAVDEALAALGAK
ncbi:hypothetical protein [Halosimplex sp. J119]